MKRLGFLLLLTFSSFLMTGCIPSMDSAMGGGGSGSVGPNNRGKERTFTYYPFHTDADFYTNGQKLFIVFERYNAALEIELSTLSDDLEPNRKNIIKASDAEKLSAVDYLSYEQIELNARVAFDPATGTLKSQGNPLPKESNTTEIYTYYHEHLPPSHMIKPVTLSYCVRNESIGTKFIYIEKNKNPKKRDSSGNFTL